MIEIIKIYRRAKKRVNSNLEIYDSLKKVLEETIDGDMRRLKTYKMKCDSYKVSDFSISVLILAISGIALAVEVTSSISIVFVALLLILIETLIIAILYHRESIHRETLFVLNDIEKEMQHERHKSYKNKKKNKK